MTYDSISALFDWLSAQWFVVFFFAVFAFVRWWIERSHKEKVSKARLIDLFSERRFEEIYRTAMANSLERASSLLSEKRNTPTLHPWTKELASFSILTATIYTCIFALASVSFFGTDLAIGSIWIVGAASDPGGLRILLLFCTVSFLFGGFRDLGPWTLATYLVLATSLLYFIALQEGIIQNWGGLTINGWGMLSFPAAVSSICFAFLSTSRTRWLAILVAAVVVPITTMIAVKTANLFSTSDEVSVIIYIVVFHCITASIAVVSVELANKWNLQKNVLIVYLACLLFILLLLYFNTGWNHFSYFFGFLLLANILADFFSTGCTRFMTERGLREVGWRTVYYAALDVLVAFIAIVLVVLLFLTLSQLGNYVAQTTIFLLDDNGGSDIFGASGFAGEVLKNPDQYVWMIAAFASTLVPTLAHFVFAITIAVPSTFPDFFRGRLLATLADSDEDFDARFLGLSAAAMWITLMITMPVIVLFAASDLLISNSNTLGALLSSLTSTIGTLLPDPGFSTNG